MSRARPTNCSTIRSERPSPAQPVHHLEDLVDDDRSQTERQLVGQDDAGVGDQRPGQRQHLLLPPLRVPAACEPLAQDGKAAAARSTAASTSLAAGVHGQVLPHGQRPEDGVALGDEAQPELLAGVLRPGARRARRRGGSPPPSAGRARPPSAAAWSCRRRWRRAGRPSCPAGRPG